MENPNITIKFDNFTSMQKQVREVHIKNIREAMMTSKGNAHELQQWMEFFKEGLWLSRHLYGEAMYGPTPTVEDKAKLSQ